MMRRPVSLDGSIGEADLSILFLIFELPLLLYRAYD